MAKSKTELLIQCFHRTNGLWKDHGWITRDWGLATQAEAVKHVKDIHLSQEELFNHWLSRNPTATAKQVAAYRKKYVRQYRVILREITIVDTVVS